jgi:hypothetical protein
VNVWVSVQVSVLVSVRGERACNRAGERVGGVRVACR